MDVLSRRYWIRSSKDFHTVICMWMISLSSALTLFLILNICKVFVISSASMVWASTLISVHLQWIILVWESQVDYLGMRVWGSGDYPLVKHTEIISTFSCSTDKKGLQHFLRILNFYRRFIQCAPRILHPLTEALKGKPSVLTWNLEMNQSFEASKLSWQIFQHWFSCCSNPAARSIRLQFFCSLTTNL